MSSNQLHTARLRAAAEPHTGSWLQGLPSPNLGLLLDPETTRIAVALRLGANICEPHQCRCGKLVSSLAHHGLSCQKVAAAGRFPRHSNLNDIVKRSLSSAGIPSWLEPVGLSRNDGKRPDGLTAFPFSSGRSLCWDATCSDTFSPSSINDTCITPGILADRAETRKRAQYSCLTDRYRFEPLSVETTGVMGKSSAKFVAELGRRIATATGDKRETSWLRQRISIAIIRGNASSILSTGHEAFASL